MRSQNKTILVGGLLVFLGYVLGSVASDGSAYAQVRSSSGEWAGVSVPNGGGAVLFQDGTLGPRVYFVDSEGHKKYVK